MENCLKLVKLGKSADHFYEFYSFFAVCNIVISVAWIWGDQMQISSEAIKLSSLKRKYVVLPIFYYV